MGTERTIVLVDGEAPPRFIPSKRFTLALLVFFAFIIQYSQRVNLPIAIVCMVNKTKPIKPQSLRTMSNSLTNKLGNKSTLSNQTTMVQQKIGCLFDDKQFYWSEFQQQLLLGGYWAGYIFTQVPGK